MSLVDRLFDPKDSSLEIHDVAGLSLLFAHVGIAVHAAYHGAPVDLQSFGTGGP